MTVVFYSIIFFALICKRRYSPTRSDPIHLKLCMRKTTNITLIKKLAFSVCHMIVSLYILCSIFPKLWWHILIVGRHMRRINIDCWRLDFHANDVIVDLSIHSTFTQSRRDIIPHANSDKKQPGGCRTLNCCYQMACRLHSCRCHLLLQSLHRSQPVRFPR